jgi:hypothetical protein
MKLIFDNLEARTGFKAKILNTISGGLNHNYVVRDISGKYPGKWMLRVPISNPTQRLAIRQEYLSVGYLQTGNEFSFRTLPEQSEFSRIIHGQGLPVQKVLDYSDSYMLVEFIEGQPLDQFLMQGGNPKLIENYLGWIQVCHERDMIMGDRWSPNTMVVDGEHITFFDFDIQLTAADAKEFEIAQAMYYCLLGTSNKPAVERILKEIILKAGSIYDRGRTIYYLQGLADHFADNPAEGGIQQIVRRFLERLL